MQKDSLTANQPKELLQRPEQSVVRFLRVMVILYNMIEYDVPQNPWLVVKAHILLKSYCIDPLKKLYFLVLTIKPAIRIGDCRLLQPFRSRLWVCGSSLGLLNPVSSESLHPRA